MKTTEIRITKPAHYQAHGRIGAEITDDSIGPIQCYWMSDAQTFDGKRFHRGAWHLVTFGWQARSLTALVDRLVAYRQRSEQEMADEALAIESASRQYAEGYAYACGYRD